MIIQVLSIGLVILSLITRYIYGDIPLATYQVVLAVALWIMGADQA